MTYFLLTALAVSTYFWFRNRAELSAMGDLYVNKCFDYDAAMAVNGELQAELDAVSDALEGEMALRFEREFYGVDTVGEAAALVGRRAMVFCFTFLSGPRGAPRWGVTIPECNLRPHTMPKRTD